MVQVQLVIDINETDGQVALWCHNLEREDANATEREFAKMFEDLCRAIMEETAKQDPEAKITIIERKAAV